MEDYKKKYEEALERAEIAHKDEDKHLKATLERIFPELKESEDERIREDIIKCLKYSGIKSDRPINPRVSTTREEALAWLEKQKEPELEEDFGDFVEKLHSQFPEVSFAKLSRITVRVKNWLESQDNKLNK